MESGSGSDRGSGGGSGGSETWVFAYGSLLWNPGFEPAEAVRARLDGYRRSFCLRSLHWRGTEERPGLVAALEEDGAASCEGLALRLPEEGLGEVLEGLRGRELVSNAYEERRVALALVDGREVLSLAYVARPEHPQYACLPLDEQAQAIAAAAGQKGSNREYLLNTAERLRALGIGDPGMEALAQRVASLDPA